MNTYEIGEDWFIQIDLEPFENGYYVVRDIELYVNNNLLLSLVYPNLMFVTNNKVTLNEHISKSTTLLANKGKLIAKIFYVKGEDYDKNEIRLPDCLRCIDKVIGRVI